MTDPSQGAAPLWVALAPDTPARLDPTLGGKGAGLRRLLQHRWPVPRAFVLTTEAWRLLLGQLRGLTEPAALRTQLQQVALPPPLLQALDDGWRWLTSDDPDAPLAVRSSSAGEDQQGQSFAGQQLTRLGVVGRPALETAVRAVWASLFGAEALLYRSQMHLDAAPPQMAVVVQRLVHADRAGVCFTANPATFAPQELVISACRGLGEAVVSGQDSDTFYLHRADLQVARQEIADKRARLVWDPLGATRHDPLDETLASAPSLTTDELGRVATLALQVEAGLGGFQDIEWALDGDGALWLLQSRPISPPKRSAGAPGGVSCWTNINVGEALPGVGTPMTWSILKNFSRRGFEAAFGALGLEVPPSYELVGSFYGRVYLNLSQFASVITQIPLMAPKTLLRLAGGPDAAAVEGHYERTQGRFLRRLPLTLPKMAASHLTLPRQGVAWAKKLRAERDAFFAQGLEGLSAAQLLGRLAHLDALFDQTGELMIAVSSNFLSSYVVTQELLRRWGGAEAAAQERHLFSGLSDLRSAEPGLELLRLAHMAQGHPALAARLREGSAQDLAQAPARLREVEGGAQFVEGLEGFLRAYGHRAPREAELATPRWREDSRFLFEVIKTHLDTPGLRGPDALMQERAQARQEMTQAIRRYFPTGLGVVFRAALGWSQRNARLREDLRACVVDTLSMYRHFFLEVGRRLKQRGVLLDSGEVFFLTYAECKSYLQREGDSADLGLRVAIRRTAYEAFCAMPDPPETFLLKGGRVVLAEAQEATSAEGREALRGLAGSPGRVTGRARVVLDPHGPEARLSPGEVLVAPFTDVGWTPLFLAAAGVIMDKGGPLSHSCVVAREYGIPAVVNAKRASSVIKTGDWVTLDGDEGVVYLGVSAP